MIIDVSSILKVSGGKIDIDCNIDASCAEFMGTVYKFTSPVSVKGNISNNGKSLFLRAECNGKMQTQCARCLKDIEETFYFPLEEQLIQNEDAQISEDEDVIVFDGYTFELDEIILNNFLMNINGSYLCKEDCMGLCPSCGKNLNEGDCSCENIDIDPRWSTLLDIMKNSEN